MRRRTGFWILAVTSPFSFGRATTLITQHSCLSLLHSIDFATWFARAIPTSSPRSCSPSPRQESAPPSCTCPYITPPSLVCEQIRSESSLRYVGSWLVATGLLCICSPTLTSFSLKYANACIKPLSFLPSRLLFGLHLSTKPKLIVDSFVSTTPLPHWYVPYL